MKPPSEFYPKKDNPFGYTPDCKVCRKKRQAKYYQDQKLQEYYRSTIEMYGEPPEAS